MAIRRKLIRSGGNKRSAVRKKLCFTLVLSGGARGSRTPDLLNAIQALSQLSYGPTRDAVSGQSASELEIGIVTSRRNPDQHAALPPAGRMKAGLSFPPRRRRRR